MDLNTEILVRASTNSSRLGFRYLQQNLLNLLVATQD